MRNPDYDPNAAITRYRRRHPEKVRQWRIAENINFLRKHGYTVIAPDAMEASPHEPNT